MSQSKQNKKNNNLRNFFRLLIVFVVWLVAALVPSSAIGFYQTIFVASLTALYEYVIIYLDSKVDEARIRLTLTGLVVSALYLLFSFFGLSNLIILDTHSLKFHLNDALPIPKASSIYWNYYITVLPMVVFPGIIIIEMLLKKPVVVVKSKQRGQAL